MNMYMNNRNIVPANSGRAFGGRIFGGISDMMRMRTGAQLQDMLHESKTSRELEADKARTTHEHKTTRDTAEHLTGELGKREQLKGSEERKTIGKTAREARKTTEHSMKNDLSHMVNLTEHVRSGNIDPNLILESPGGTRLQARGQGFRTPKPDTQG
jgi:hypothetical protein